MEKTLFEKLNKLPELVEKNLDIFNVYFENYPTLREYIKLESSKDESRSEEDFNKSVEMWQDLIKLKITNVYNYYSVIQNQLDYFLNKKKARLEDILDDIDSEITELLKRDEYNVKSDRYNNDSHKRILFIKEAFENVITNKDLEKIFNNIYKYFDYDYDPFYNKNHLFTNYLMNNSDIVVEDDKIFDVLNILNIDILFITLRKCSVAKALKSEENLIGDKKKIEEIVNLLVPICKRYKESDECWENNFFSNKILSEVRKRLE